MDEFKDFTDDFVVVDAVPGELLPRFESDVVDFSLSARKHGVVSLGNNECSL
jgi:hypothetical protein